MSIRMLRVLIYCAVALGATGTLAMSCPIAGRDIAMLKASTVFIGEVVAGRYPKSGDNIPLDDRWTFRVLELFVGSTPREGMLTVHNPLPSAYVGFVLGRKYLVYAEGAGEIPTVTMCGRTKPLEAANDDLIWLKSLVQPLPPRR